MPFKFIVKAKPKEAWLIWSNQHRAWWAPNCNGYVSSSAHAGRYDFDTAMRACRNANGPEPFIEPKDTMVKTLVIESLTQEEKGPRSLADLLDGPIIKEPKGLVAWSKPSGPSFADVLNAMIAEANKTGKASIEIPLDLDKNKTPPPKNPLFE